MNSTLGNNLYSFPRHINDTTDPAAKVSLELAMDNFPEPEPTLGPDIAAWVDAELYAHIVDSAMSRRA
jgi:hypothetical protein